MAVKKVIELEVDVDALQKSVTEIQNDFKELKDSVQGFDQTSKQTNKDLKKGFKGVSNQVVSLQQGFTGLALALKSIGIGLVLEAFNTFKAVLQSNQEVSDAFAIAFGTITNLFNGFVNFLLDNFEKATGPVTKFFESDIFEGINYCRNRAIEEFGEDGTDYANSEALVNTIVYWVGMDIDLENLF